MGGAIKTDMLQKQISKLEKEQNFAENICLIKRHTLLELRSNLAQILVKSIFAFYNFHYFLCFVILGPSIFPSSERRT